MIGRKASVQRGLYSHQKRKDHPPDRIGVRIASVEEPQKESSDWAGSNQTDRHVEPQAPCSHGLRQLPQPVQTHH